jgi:hypothetical protein
MSEKPSQTHPAAAVPSGIVTPLLSDLRQLIQSARERAAAAVNAELTLLCWRVGTRLRVEILKEQRAEYGRQIVATVAEELLTQFGKGFERTNLFRMMRFAELFPEEQIVATLSPQLSWSHFVEILVIKDDLARKFYVEMSRLERWSVRTLRDKINGMLYERTALSRKPEETIRLELQALSESGRAVGTDPLHRGGAGAGCSALPGSGKYPRGRVPDRAAFPRGVGARIVRGGSARTRTDRPPFPACRQE